MAAPQPEPAVHTGPWTLEEWLALPQGPPYTELVDGLLVMSPVSAYPRQRLMVRLWQQLDAAAPPEYEVMPESNVALGGDRALIPDFCVIDRPGFDGVILSARHVVLVGEIASPSTRLYDRTTKRALYAEAGIPYLLMVDQVCFPVDLPGVLSMNSTRPTFPARQMSVVSSSWGAATTWGSSSVGSTVYR